VCPSNRARHVLSAGLRDGRHTRSTRPKSEPRAETHSQP